MKILNSLAQKLYKQLSDEIDNTLVKDQEPLKTRETCIWACVRHLQLLKQIFKDNLPLDKTEEIEFFKQIKPRFKAQLLYHQALYSLECRKPAGGNKILKDFYKNELIFVARFYEANSNFYQYLRQGSSHLDEFYFLRGRFDIHLHPFEGFVDFDPEFNTSHDHMAAKILADEGIIIKLEEYLYQLEHPIAIESEKSIGTETAHWTETKSGLIELIYGIHGTKAVENGDITLKKLAKIFEVAFNISLGNFYDTFDFISGRHNQTTYIDELREALSIRIRKKFK